MHNLQDFKNRGMSVKYIYRVAFSELHFALLVTFALWSVDDVRGVRGEPVNVTVAVMEDNVSPSLRFGWNRTMPAVNMAEERVKLLYRDHIHFTFTYHETTCSSVGASAIFADIRCRYGLSVLIGPGCSTPMYSIAPLAMAWDIPVVNPIASGLYDKELYPLVTALSPFSPASFAGAIKAFLKQFGYTHIIIVEDTLTGFATPRILKETLISSLRSSPEYSWREFQANSGDVILSDINKLLDQAKTYSRVFVLFTRLRAARAIMLEAARRGLATSGEFVFLIIHKLSWGPDLGWRDPEASDEENAAFLESLGQAYFPYIQAWPEIRRGDNFTEELIRRSLEDYGFDYGGVLPTQWVPGYYDAVMMYAQVLNESLAEGGSPTDGLAITRSLVNRTFSGVLREVKINEEGIRLNDVTFGYYELGTAAWKRAAIWHYQTDRLEELPPGFVWRYNQNVPPPNEPNCGYSGEKCSSDENKNEIIALALGLTVGILFATLIVSLLFHRLWRKQIRTDLWWWKIDPSDLAFMNTENFSVFGSTMKESKRNFGSLPGPDGTFHISDACLDDFAIWKGQRVRVNRLALGNLSLSQELLLEFDLIREVNHSNISKGLGACLAPTLNALVTERCSKGNLQDLLGNFNVTLDEQFKFSLCTDIINGLCYLHDSPVRFHGRLNSEVCLIDNRFTVKLADYGLTTLYSALVVNKSSQEYKKECLWKAPELLRGDTLKQFGGREADIYSCAIVMDEVFTREAPYFAESDLLTLDEILDKVAAGLKPPFRPCSKIWSHDMRSLLEQCWAEEPRLRPTGASVRNSLRRIVRSLGASTNILDNLMRRMEMYANNLEKMVEDKTIELREEKKRSDELLYQILPRSVAHKLRLGQRVEPQSYESVTIFFSDIVGFTSLSAESSPFEIVTFLNDLYTCFDAIIDEYDVYKVETIGDAYMVVSGLPQENGNLHAVHIANMSLKLLEAITEFKIQHRPQMRIMLRIGCHSGSVVAGVVGLKMPRYCLFGDTVNTASRMESNGEALKIHLSQSVKNILDCFDMFMLEPRGAIPVKGKGFMETYWLTGRVEESLFTAVVHDFHSTVLEEKKAALSHNAQITETPNT
ncbi:hypothetical protein RRG08_042087 [Elysia crispata]|uniref:Guanylate cyclase n=1 Tax=Elysia crispata TaxID=231223 RepID=A0AAE1B2U1_9GAST|nr:hypothetical protein RRG08_042087 [Elysia crispata]